MNMMAKVKLEEGKTDGMMMVVSEAVVSVRS